MNDLLPISIAAVIVLGIVLIVGKKFTISSRYERTSHQLNPWSAQDKGFDPTEEEKS